MGGAARIPLKCREKFQASKYGIILGYVKFRGMLLVGDDGDKVMPTLEKYVFIEKMMLIFRKYKGGK